MKKFDSKETIAAIIPIKEMVIDEYQGHVNKSIVQKIAVKWDAAAAGAVILNLRDDNTYAVLDGQHRVLAARLRGDVHELAALVFIGKTRDEEARLFVQLNTKHNVDTMDRFRANLIAGATEEKNIRRALQDVGLDVALKGPGSKQVQCPGELVRIYTAFGLIHFKQVVGIVAAAYKGYDDPRGYVAQVFGGVSQFIARYPHADTKRIIQKLSERAPIVMLGMSAAKKERGQDNNTGFGMALTSLYNSGYRQSSNFYLPPDVWQKKLVTPAGKKAREESEKVKEQIKQMHRASNAHRFQKGRTPYNKGLKMAAKSKKA